MTNSELLATQLESGFQLLKLGVLVVGTLFLGFTFQIVLRTLRKSGKRMFGFNCDGCAGKYRSDGQPFYRCKFKKPILYKLIKMGWVKPIK